MTRARLDRRPDEVAAMFDKVAGRYDVMNRLMTFGLETAWRRAAVAAVDPRSGQRVLDLAAGTGTSSAVLADRGAEVVACDFSLGMLTVGRARQIDTDRLEFVAGDALRLPFADGSFDAVTISFGLRNVADVPAALAEMRRVTRPGGSLVICETSQPTWAPLRAGQRQWLKVLPAVADRVASNPAAYRYLIESMLSWPSQSQLAATIAAAGWRGVQWRNLTGGVVALHRATR